MSTHTTHTPGKWQHHDEDYCPEEIYGDLDGPLEDGHVHGELVCTVNMEHERGWANARLIIAAPDLLAALAQMCLYSRAPGDDGPHDDGFDNARRMARAAIAKARA